jgi:hypothetical protein
MNVWVALGLSILRTRVSGVAFHGKRGLFLRSGPNSPLDTNFA